MGGNPTRRKLLLFGPTIIALHGQQREELLMRWNQFAKDANAYVANLNAGVLDLRMRQKLVREWESMTRCECW